MLSKVSDFISKYLDPSKGTYQNLYINGVLLESQLTKKEYYWALSISSENDFKLHLKRSKNFSCFINNYNPVVWKALQANIGLQPVYNHYKAVSYMTAHFSKSENSTLEAMKQAVQEIKLQNLSARVTMKKLAYSFICS